MKARVILRGDTSGQFLQLEHIQCVSVLIEKEPLFVLIYDQDDRHFPKYTDEFFSFWRDITLMQDAFQEQPRFFRALFPVEKFDVILVDDTFDYDADPT